MSCCGPEGPQSGDVPAWHDEQADHSVGHPGASHSVHCICWNTDAFLLRVQRLRARSERVQWTRRRIARRLGRGVVRGRLAPLHLPLLAALPIPPLWCLGW